MQTKSDEDIAKLKTLSFTLEQYKTNKQDMTVQLALRTEALQEALQRKHLASTGASLATDYMNVSIVYRNDKKRR